MAVFISITHRNKPVVYTVSKSTTDVYLLRLQGSQGDGDNLVPGKIVLRRKGKIWVSDAENCQELIEKLTAEVSHLNTKKQSA